MKKSVKFIKARVAALTTSFLVSAPTVLASAVDGKEGSVKVDWPWMKFFNSLAEQLTGPLPMVLGIMGIAGAAIALFSGHAGGGTQKFILLILAVSIALFAPNFMTAISESVGALTIMEL